MPLSEHEQRVLQQMEQALYAEDPRFATQMANERPPLSRGRVILGALGALAGLGVILLAVSMANPWIGVAGFVLMVAGVAWALTRPADLDTPGNVTPLAAGRRKKTSTRGKRTIKGGGFMSRLENRWDERGNDRW